MKKAIISTCFILFISFLPAQTKVGDVSVPNTLNAGSSKLVLNGAGIREKYFMDMYVGALYLLQKSKDASKITQADEAMSIKLHIVSSMITSSRMEEAIDEGFKNSTNNNTVPLKDKIAQFRNVFKEAIKIGDIFDITYIPAEGVIISKNNIKKVTITGLDFKKAIFGIWLGKEPADDDLKKAMLGNG